ncbi:DUF2993 domain-containing protein [Actinotalea sp. AC32]|nr:DUF2993 domain-containing protein [Actinotalea sp. AC32]
MGARGVVGTVLVLGVLVGGAVVADGVARDRTEERLASELRRQIPGLDTEPDVAIGGVPFLTQLVGGELDTVRVTAPSAVLEGLPLHDVDVHLTGVSTDEPTTAREATMSALARTEDLSEVLDLGSDLRVEGEHLVASFEVLTATVDVVLAPTAAGREIAVDVVELRALGGSVDPDDVPGLGDRFDALTVPVDQLPEGLELTRLTVVEEGVRIEAGGSDVVLPTQ